MDKKFKYEKTASDPEKCDAKLKKSAWINVGSKLKKIFPYIWPKSKSKDCECFCANDP